MALTIEDGTGVANADSYVTDAEFTDYAAERGITLPGDATAREILLKDATDYLETLDYIGARATFAQPLSWPRVDASVDGFALDSDYIPRELKKAQILLAIDAANGVDLLPTITPSATGAVVEETVEGAVSVKYAPPGRAEGGDTASGAKLTKAMAVLRPLLRTGSVITQLKVRRG